MVGCLAPSLSGMEQRKQRSGGDDIIAEPTRGGGSK